MATRYWISGSSSNWNNTSNWSTSSGGSGGSSVPNSGDTAIFDGNGTGSCRMDVALTSGTIIDLQSGYTGTLDAATDDLNHNVGDVTLSGGSATVSLGDGTWTVSGNWDGLNLGTFNRNSSTVVFSGTSKTVDNADDFHNITVSGTISTSNALDFRGLLSISGTLTIGTSKLLRAVGNFADIQISSGGITGTGSAALRYAGTSTFTTLSVSLDINLEVFGVNPPPNGTYNGSVFLQPTNSANFVFSAGTYTFNNDVSISILSGRSVTFTMSTNDPDIIFQGDLDISNEGTFSYLAGTGLWTFSGTNDQDVSIAYGIITEDVEINKSSGTITFNSDIYVDELTCTSGDIDFNGQTIEIADNLIIREDCTVNTSTLGGTIFNIGGDFAANGESGNRLDLRASSTWELNITGTGLNDFDGYADYVLVAYSDASGGSTVSATNSIDYDDNVNWVGLNSLISASVSEGVKSSDVGSNIANLFSYIQDTILLGDLNNKSCIYPVLIQDGCVFGDLNSRLLIIPASIQEGITLTDIYNRSKIILASVSEGLGAGDADSNLASLKRTISDEILGGDSWEKILQTISQVIDGFTTGETLESRLTKTSSIIEGIKAGDINSAVLALLSSFSDGIKVGDTKTVIKTILASLQDSIESGETWETVLTKYLDMAESTVFSDSLSVEIAFSNVLSNGVKYSDEWSNFLNALRNIQEGSLLGDIMTSIVRVFSIVSDGVKLGETWAISSMTNGVFSEGSIVGDNISVVGSLLSAILEGTTLSNEYASTLLGLSGYSETVLLSDDIVGNVLSLSSAVDGLLLSDILNAIVRFPLQTTESAVAGDIFQSLVLLTKFWNDGILVSDEFSSNADLLSQLINGVYISDLLNVSMIGLTNVQESSIFGETYSVRLFGLILEYIHIWTLSSRQTQWILLPREDSFTLSSRESQWILLDRPTEYELSERGILWLL